MFLQPNVLPKQWPLYFRQVANTRLLALRDLRDGGGRGLIQIRGNHITRTVKDIYNSPYIQSGSPPKSLKMIEEVLYTLLTLLET